ncbi:MAG TPA: hypothetical protein VIF15_04540 [Polyangiaceae bacterium]
MIRETAGVWLAVATVALAACGSCSSSSGSTLGGGGDGGPGDSSAVEAGPSATQACSDFATALCGRLEACTPFAVQVAYGDATTCAQRTALACAPALAAGGTKASPDDMEACAAAINAETCDEALDNAQPSACNIPGSLAAGAPCGSNGQCSTSFCQLAKNSACGTCASHPSAGATCVVDTDCQATLVCNSGTCVGPAASGSACSASQPCLRSLSCIGGTCKTPVAAGGACTAQTDCDGAHGGFCNTQTKQCAQTQVASAGQPCGIVGSNLVACSSGGACNIMADGGGQGTCHQPAGDGAPCGPGIACMAPAVCIATARCTIMDPGTCH